MIPRVQQVAHPTRLRLEKVSNGLCHLKCESEV